MNAVLRMNRIVGGLTNANGCCPGCGAAVLRLHSWALGQSSDAYACRACGTFRYGTIGVDLPLRAETVRPFGGLLDIVS